MLAKYDLSPYLTKAKNSTISTLDFEREKEGGRRESGRRRRRWGWQDDGEKTTIKAREKGERR